MYLKSDAYRAIAGFSAIELELQKWKYREPSLKAIIEIMHLLTVLSFEGINICGINIFENYPYPKDFPSCVSLRTGSAVISKIPGVTKPGINILWEFYREDVIQRLVMTEEV